MTSAMPDIVTAARDVREGRTSFAALTRQCLDRAAEYAHLNAFEQVFEQDAIAAAQAQDALLAAGYDLGPLQGIAIGLKSNIAIKGAALTAGSKLLAGHVATRDAEVTRRLRRAGAVILGTTNMHEFAWGGTTANPHYGQARNPHDPEHSPAGSSGGSGVAVASGAVFAALGTDTGGSVRLPAAMNGIVGLRPGIGRLPVDGIFPLAWSLDTVGPMARTSRDTALLLDAMADRPPRPPVRDMRGLRIGIPRAYIFDRIEGAVGAAFTAWTERMRDNGAELVDIMIPDLDCAVDALLIVDAAEPTTVHDAWIDTHPEAYGADVLNQLIAGRAITATEYLHAQRFRTVFREGVRALLRQVDVIATPTIACTVPKIGQTSVLLSGHVEPMLTALMRFTSIASCAGLPAVSLPAQVSGLPVGIQLIGDDGSEDRLLALA